MPPPRKKKHPNALFDAWLLKAMESARSKELKSYHSYKLALASLRKYPVPLSGGKECRILKGFGVKMCDWLDNELQKFADSLDLSIEEAISYGNALHSESSGSTAAPTMPRRRKSSTKKNTVTAIEAKKSPPPPDLTAYFKPQQSTNHDDTMNNRVVLSNCLPTEEMASNCPQVDDPEPSTVVVIDQAEATVVDSINSIDHSSPPPFPALPATTGQSNRLDELIDTVGTTHDSLPAPSSSSYPLQFAYVDRHGGLVTKRVDAAVDEDDCEPTEGGGQGFRIQCTYTDLLRSGLDYRLDFAVLPRQPNDGKLFVYLLDVNAPLEGTEPCPANSQQRDNTLVVMPPTLPGQETTFIQTKPVDCDDGNAKADCPSLTTTTSYYILSQSISEGLCTTFPTTTSTFHPAIPSLALSSSHYSTASSLPHTSSTPPVLHPLMRQQQEQVESTSQLTNCRLLPSMNLPSATMTSSNVTERFFPANSYEIILLTDNRELFGLGRVKQLLPPLLQSFSIKCESRVLPVGDFLWIARCRQHDGTVQEAVLDYIVERKRIDDLAHSITDGRFQEQKINLCLLHSRYQYRLKRTSLKHVIYLFEECSSMKNQRIAYETLLQAMSNCEIIDGFQVVTTRKSDDTVQWLVTLTRLLTRIATSDLTIVAHRREVHSNQPCAVDWADFNAMATKTPPPSIHDMFARQLLQLPGLSGSKVAALLQCYPTPRSLMQAYDHAQSDQERAQLLTKVKIPDSNRTIGPQLSRAISLAYNTV